MILGVVLGPVPCQGCGASVVWDGERWRSVVHWRRSSPWSDADRGKPYTERLEPSLLAPDHDCHAEFAFSMTAAVSA